MIDLQLAAVLNLGFLLGARHALDPDHVVAVSTLLAERADFRTSGLIGLFWGFGHTIVLLLVGLVVLLLKINIPEQVTTAIEFCVGVMLLILGGSLAWTLYQERWHLHAHRHGDTTHLHLHRHREQVGHGHDHWLRLSTRPLLIGMVHGLAGSAALMLMILSTVRTLWEGMAYIFVFGLGSILGMIALGILLTLPLILSAPFGRRAQLTLQILASVGSIGIGLMMMLRIALGEPVL